MTYEEALQLLRESKKYWARIHPIYKAHDVAIEALEKQIPKKPLLVPDGKSKIHTFKCPTCDQAMYRVRMFCDDCGQALDWSDER